MFVFVFHMMAILHEISDYYLFNCIFHECSSGYSNDDEGGNFLACLLKYIPDGTQQNTTKQNDEFRLIHYLIVDYFTFYGEKIKKVLDSLN